MQFFGPPYIYYFLFLKNSVLRLTKAERRRRPCQVDTLYVRCDIYHGKKFGHLGQMYPNLDNQVDICQPLML